MTPHDTVAVTQISPEQGATDTKRRHYSAAVPGQFRPKLPTYASTPVTMPKQARFSRFRETARLVMILFVTLVLPIVIAVAFVAAVEHKNAPRVGEGAMPAPPSVAPPSVAPSAAAPVAADPVPSVRTYPPGHSPAPRAATDPASGLQAPVGAGTYHVGEDLTSGVYTTLGPDGTGDGRCHYRRATDPSGNRRIASDDRVSRSTTISLWPGEYLTTRGCQPWTWKGPIGSGR